MSIRFHPERSRAAGQELESGRPGWRCHPGPPQIQTCRFPKFKCPKFKCHKRHRAKEFVSFLRLIDQSVCSDLDIHLILDNYATHKAPPVKQFLVAHPRFHLHFTPTHASWLNLVESFFAKLTSQQLKPASHHSVRELEQAIYDHLKAHNDNPKPFVWTKTADEILAKVARHCDGVLK